MPGTVVVDPQAPSAGARLRSGARLVICAAVPWYLCLWWGTSTAPVPAALPAVLILREDVYAAPRLAWERLLGVFVGVLLSTVALDRLPPSSLSFLAVLVCGCAGMYVLGRPGSPNQQVLITALMIYATALPGYPLARLAETLVGIAVVVLLGPLLWPPDPYRSAADGLDAYRAGVGRLLDGVAGRLARGGPPAAPVPLPEGARLWLRPQACRAAFDRAARRRRTRRPPDGLDGRLGLAARSAVTLQCFTQELQERARGLGTGPSATPGAPAAAPDPALRAIVPLVRSTALALDAALRGDEFAAELDRARGLDLAHRAAHPTRHDAVLRAGLHLTHEALSDHLASRR
ncbi:MULTISPECIES: FUSC family protein [Streptomyces]|uniref:FUSC family protein n=1 Tax=Streptomyces TaxID=1883 RepID=UPI00131E70C8|nr:MULTISPECIES: FUSC family protein [unclassified Streptomyces]